LQTPIALFEQFDVTFADVCLFVARPEVTQNFRTFRRFEVRAAKPPEDVDIVLADLTNTTGDAVFDVKRVPELEPIPPPPSFSMIR